MVGLTESSCETFHLYTGFPTFLENRENLELLSFTFPGLENAWNLLKKWEKPGIWTQNLENTWNFVNMLFQDSLFKMTFKK